VHASVILGVTAKRLYPHGRLLLATDCPYFTEELNLGHCSFPVRPEAVSVAAGSNESSARRYDDDNEGTSRRTSEYLSLQLKGFVASAY
jgi:hypothetical protein